MDAITKKIEGAKDYLFYKAGLLRRRSGRYRRRIELRLENRLKRRFKAQMNWLVDNIQELSFFQDQEAGVKRLERKTIDDEIKKIVDDLPEKEEIVDEIATTAKQGYKKGAKDEYKHFKMDEIGIDFNLINDEAIEYLQNLTELHLSDYRGSISRTTNKRIIKILLEAAEKGSSYTDTAARIKQQAVKGVFSNSRAELIAVREIGKAYTHGNRDMIKQYIRETSAIMEKEWLTVQDDKVTKECQANEEAGWLGFEEQFPSSDINSPRDSNPRCRCDTGYRRINTQGEEII